MKKIVLVILFVLSVFSLKAQFNQGLYTLKNLPLNRLYNPSAEIRYEKEILTPLISHLQVQGELYGTNLEEIFSNKSATKTIESFIKNKSGKEHAWLSEKINLLYFGFRDNTSTNYWSFGVYQELQSYTFYPADIVDLVYNGNKLDRSYNLGSFSGQLNAMTVYHAGLTYFPKGKKYNFGGRIKIYNSFATIDATGNEGNIKTIIDTKTNKASILLDGNLKLRTSGLGSFSSKSNNQLGTSPIYSGNLGLGFDLGATYHFDKHWSASASIIDIGTIYSKNDVSNYKATGVHNFEGALISDPNDTSQDFWIEMIDNFNDDITYDENNKSFFSTLPPKVFASLSYSITGLSYISRNPVRNCAQRTKKDLNYDHSFTLTSYNKLLYNYWDWTIGVSYLGELNSWLAIQGNYIYSPYDKTNFGAGISARFGWVLMYVSADNIPGLFNLNTANSAGVMAGINIVWESRN